jgi:hypothetical protein
MIVSIREDNIHCHMLLSDCCFRHPTSVLLFLEIWRVVLLGLRPYLHIVRTERELGTCSQ